MSILRDISLIWSMVHTLIIFWFLFEPRYDRRKTLAITLATMIPLCIINLVLFIVFGFEKYGTLMLVTLSLPSCLVFWFLAKHQDGRFFFSFCMVDTLVLEIIYITNILNHYLTPNTYWVMFIVRLLACSFLTVWVNKRLRTTFLEIQRNIKRGWGSFAVIGALFYIAITLLMTYPDSITNRPHQLPVLGLLFVLMPIIYSNIIRTLQRHLHIHQLTQREDMLRLQVSNLTARMTELNNADNKFRMERHNFRHKLKTIASLVETQQYDELNALLEEYSESIRESQVKRYCHSPVIDAVLSTYLQQARNKKISITEGFAFPDPIPCDESELATVLANALENAIQACEKLPVEKRSLRIKVLNHPRFLIQIANSFDGQIEFDENEIPVNRAEEHGFGTRSIVAFCDKNKVFYRFKAEDNTFSLYLNF